MRQRRLRWNAPDGPALKHPYRDTLLVYAGLALVIVLFAVLTGGNVGKAALLAAGFFVLASAWSLVHRQRALRRAARERELGEP